MDCGKIGRQHLSVMLVLAALLVMLFSADAWANNSETLLDEVVSLKLGLAGYVIGQKLEPDQKKTAQANPVDGAYEGTYKFNDKDLYVVVNTKTDRVLALYKQKKNADKKQLKAMVGELMHFFGTPTTMAHEKLVYWAFNKHGAVSEQVFNESKKIKQTKDLGIIATVKFNSDLDIAPDPVEDKESSAEKKAASTGKIYYIITSDPLVKEFMAAHPQ